MTDEELVRFCRAGDSAACNVLFEKYKPLVKSRAANKYLSGGEYDDLIQEGMIGLLAAVNDYDPVKAEGAKFGTFATLCIDRQLMHAIESARSSFVGFAFVTLCSTAEGYGLYKRNGFYDLDEDMRFSVEEEPSYGTKMYYALDLE